MNRSKIRNPKCHANPPARPAMSYPELEQIMARTRGQRAGEMRRPIRLASAKVVDGFGAVAGWVFKTRKGSRSLG